MFIQQSSSASLYNFSGQYYLENSSLFNSLEDLIDHYKRHTTVIIKSISQILSFKLLLQGQ